MRRDIRVRAEQQDPIDLERLARALLQAARDLAKRAAVAEPEPADE